MTRMQESLSLWFGFHGFITDEHSPDVSAGLGDHQYADCRHGTCEQYDRDIACKAEYYREPEILKRCVAIFFGAAVKQYDYQYTQKSKWNVADDVPEKRRVRTCPSVLREETEDDACQ